MFQNLILQVLSGILGLWLAVNFITGVEFTGEIKTLALAGLILGLINCFIKPILKIITTPLRILSFGLFSLVINMGIVWVVDILFPELKILGIISLFWATIIIWGLGILLSLFGKGAEKSKV